MRNGFCGHCVAAFPVLVAVVCMLCFEAWTHAIAADSGLEYEEICVVGETGIHRLEVALAVSERQRTLGLMGRERLAPDTGMLFIYDQSRPAGSGFWMYRTRIPLDIAWLDEDGTIISIDHMLPCDSEDPRRCPVYPAGESYRAALEVNAGYFSEHGITQGAQVYRAGDQACARDSEAR